MSLFQYQQFVEPLLPPPYVPPVFPDVVPRSRATAILAQAVYPLQPLVVPTFWAPSYPDLVPHWRPWAQAAQTVYPLQPPVPPLFWAPSYPDRIPKNRVQTAPAWCLGTFAPVIPLPPAPGFGTPDGPTFSIWERSTGRYALRLVAGDGRTFLPGSVLTSLTLTLYAIDAANFDHVINGRNQQSILNANNGQVLPDGTILWTIQAADTTKVTTAPFERHIALFEWTWPGGAGKHEGILVVHALRLVS